MANLKNTIITTGNNFKLPSGSESQRPATAQDGMIRYNSEKQSPEKYNGSGWTLFKLLPGLNYSIFDTQVYVTANDHPTNTSEMDQFFNDANDGINLLSQGVFARKINWGYEGQAGGGGLVGLAPPVVPADYAAWTVEGYIYAPETGTYIIGCDSDDASDVFVNGQLTANWYGGHGFDGAWENGSHVNTANHFTGSINLIAGNYYTFSARQEERTGGSGMQVGWKKPSDSQIELIPSSYFFRKA